MMFSEGTGAGAANFGDAQAGSWPEPGPGRFPSFPSARFISTLLESSNRNSLYAPSPIYARLRVFSS